jgi:hypothetical protein
MKRLMMFLIILGLGTGAIWVAQNAFRSMKDYDLSLNVVYGEALRACEEDGAVCSFSSLESAQQYLDSSEHRDATAMRELKKQQDATASKEASAAIEGGKHRNKWNSIRKIN